MRLIRYLSVFILIICFFPVINTANAQKWLNVSVHSGFSSPSLNHYGRNFKGNICFGMDACYTYRETDSKKILTGIRFSYNKWKPDAGEIINLTAYQDIDPWEVLGGYSAMEFLATIKALSISNKTTISVEGYAGMIYTGNHYELKHYTSDTEYISIMEKGNETRPGIGAGFGLMAGRIGVNPSYLYVFGERPLGIFSVKLQIQIIK